jgi:hypothetical protein
VHAARACRPRRAATAKKGAERCVPRMQVKKKSHREALSSAEGTEAAKLSKRLVRLRTELELPPTKFEMDALRLRRPADGGDAVLKAFAGLQLRQHADRLKRLWETRIGATAAGS